MKWGRVIAEGRPADIVTPALVAEVFGLSCRIVPDPFSAAPMVVPVGRRHGATT